jgi:hypothetical protein
MPQATFAVAATADNNWVRRIHTSYPPTAGTLTRSTTDDDLWAERTFVSPDYRVACALMRWDTSSIPDSATITSAKLRVVSGSNGVINNGYDVLGEWYLFDGTSADWTATPSSTAFSIDEGTSWEASGTVKEWALSNPNANVSKSGMTGIRVHMASGTPTGNNQVFFASYDDPTLASPQLIVDYSLPSLGGDLVGMVGI